MLYRPAASLLLLLALLSPATARGRKGSSGSSGDSDGGDDDGGDIDDSDSGSGGSGGSSGPSRPCSWLARQHAFGLPGLYYNGTLTIKHQVKYNTAWEDANERFNDCDNNDKENKTYEYPALLLVGPTANESDTNPMHWVLRGHQPPGSSYRGVDFLQRWVYIRSSDFVVSNRTTLYGADYLVDRLEDIDATDLDDATRVYWTTNVTAGENDSKVFSARAEYTEHPPIIDPDNKAYRSMYHPGRRTSSYVTLSDVCTFSQKRVGEDHDGYEEDVEQLRVGPSPLEVDTRSLGSRGSSPTKREYQALAAGTPTLWLEKGVSVEMENIGGPSMSWSLQSTTMTRAIPWYGMREPGCRQMGSEITGFELSDFYPLQSTADEEENEERGFRPWNITVEFSLSFRGDLVRENSTTLDGYEDGKLVFGRDYTEFTTEESDEQEDGAMGLSPVRTSILSIAVIWLLFVLQ